MNELIEAPKQTPEMKEVAKQKALDSALMLYSYDRTTRAFVGAERAELDPAEWDVNGLVRWLIPANCTDIAPPQHSDSQMAVFDEQANAWSIVPKDLVQGDEAPVPTKLAEQIAMACHNIDRSVDEFIFRVIGNRAVEYMMAEQDAQDFKARGYPEDVPASILADAEAFNRSAQEAADAILAQAEAWRSALKLLRGGRLKAKQDARNAASVDDLTLVLEGWVDFLRQMEVGA